MAWVEAWLSSASSTTSSGSVAGTARRTSRLTASSRTLKSAPVSPVTDTFLLSTTLTKTSRVRTSLAAGGRGSCAATDTAAMALSASKYRVFFICGPLRRVYSDGDRHLAETSGLADSMRQIGALSTVGLSFVLAIAIGSGIGYFLMTKLGLGSWVFLLFFRAWRGRRNPQRLPHRQPFSEQVSGGRCAGRPHRPQLHHHLPVVCGRGAGTGGVAGRQRASSAADC